MSQKEAFELTVEVLAEQPEEVKRMVCMLVAAAALNTVGLDSAKFWDKQNQSSGSERRSAEPK